MCLSGAEFRLGSCKEQEPEAKLPQTWQWVLATPWSPVLCGGCPFSVLWYTNLPFGRCDL